MRVDVKKVLFIGLREERKPFFAKAQEAGIIHFIETEISSFEVPAKMESMTNAIKVLRSLPTMPQEELVDYSLADGLVHKILQLNQKIGHLQEEQRTTRLDIERVGVFGDFSLEEIAWIEKTSGRKIQFFFAKHGAAETLHLPDEVLYIGTQHELDYFIAINPQETQYPKLIEMRIEHPVGELQTRDRQLTQEIHETEERLKSYAKYNTFLHHALVHHLNSYHLEHAENSVKWPVDNALFAIEAWVPVNKVEKVEQIVRKMHMHMSEIAIDPTDVIPTRLDNEGLNRVGEDLVHIYDTPSHTDRDPSLWVLFSFALFFSFIVGDAGYGLIFLIVALYCRYKFPGIQGVKKRVLNLVTLLCFVCIGWGILTNSLFGITFSPDNPIRRISLIQWLVEKKAAYHMAHHDEVYQYWVKRFPAIAETKDPAEFVREAASQKDETVTYDLISKFTDSIMLELALFIGVVHIILSMLRYLPRNWSNAGWIAFIIGCYLYFPHYLQATSMLQYVLGIDPAKAAPNGLYLITGGISVALVLALIRHGLAGLAEPMNLIQVFADILSYLRLYALGLSGSIVTSIMNEAFAVVPLVVGILILIVGHAVNMLLAVMSGIIHGLRLNFLEWYHYSFEGGGKPFKPLEKLKVE